MEAQGVARRWSSDLTTRPRAIVRAGNKLLLGGRPCEDTLAAYRGDAGGILVALAVEDGSSLTSVPLESPPVWDGLAAASGRVYAACQDGSVICLR
jgi:hypothetical protein